VISPHAAAQRVLLGLLDQAFEIVAGDVDVFAELPQRLVDVVMGEAHALAGRQVMGVMDVLATQPRLRIGMPGEVVVDQRNRHQQQ